MQNTAETLPTKLVIERTSETPEVAVIECAVVNSEIKTPEKVVIAALTTELARAKFLSDAEKEQQLRFFGISLNEIAAAKDPESGKLGFLPAYPDIYFNHYPATLARLISLFSVVQPLRGETFFCDIVDDCGRYVSRGDIAFLTANELAKLISGSCDGAYTASVRIAQNEAPNGDELQCNQSYYRIMITKKV